MEENLIAAVMPIMPINKLRQGLDMLLIHHKTVVELDVIVVRKGCANQHIKQPTEWKCYYIGYLKP